jgi:hypothetical protein
MQETMAAALPKRALTKNIIGKASTAYISQPVVAAITSRALYVWGLGRKVMP